MSLSDDAKKLFDGAKEYLLSRDIFIEERKLGAGGFSTVFAGTFCKTPCAIKISHKPISEEANLQKEAERGPSIWPLTREHRGLTTLLWNGEIPIDSAMHLCTIWAQAECSLKERRPTSIAEIIDLLRPVAAALDFLHAQNILHRDIKPANILLFRSEKNACGYVAQLGDLGNALPVMPDHQGTNTGTPEYCHPEQFWDGRVDKCCDVYSLAWVFVDAVWRAGFTAQRPKVNLHDCVEVAELLSKLNLTAEHLALLSNVLVLDNHKRENLTARELINGLSQGLASATKDGLDDELDLVAPFIQSLRFAPSNSVLFKVGLSPDVVRNLSACAIGANSESLPIAVQDNISLVGIFRAKELAHELRSVVEIAVGAARKIRTGVNSQESQDRDSIMLEPIGAINYAAGVLSRRKTYQQSIWPQYDQLANMILAVVDVAATEMGKILTNTRPATLNAEVVRDANPDEETGVHYNALQALSYEEKLPYYLRAAEKLEVSLAAFQKSTKEFYVQLCEVLESESRPK